MAYKYLFFDDYSEGAHPRILETLGNTNLVQELGYGEDSICLEAARLVKEKVRDREADVYFVSGGTQANFIALASMLKPYESVVAVTTAHINTHEAGAVEATGHKIHGVKGLSGKITPEAIRDIAAQHTDEHMVKPKVVFISHATEIGTAYEKRELEAVSKTCKELNLYLYLDGARLGSALASSGADITLADLPKLVDMFYIGGTKNGALVGEAIVIVNPELRENFRFYLKQRGALLAKGRVLGAQFVELFKDDLFFELARHANSLAGKLSRGMGDCGYGFLTPSSTNQIFPILPNVVINRLKEKYGFYVWSKIDETNSAVRLVTSWATNEESVGEFLEDLKKIS
jgi:threonine aldolase